MPKKTVDQTYISPTSKISNLEFTGDGKFEFNHNKLFIENCDFSIFHHIHFKKRITELEIFGHMTFTDSAKMVKKIKVERLIICVDQCDAIIDAALNLFSPENIKLHYWKKSTVKILIPKSVNAVLLSHVDCSKLSQLEYDSNDCLNFEHMKFTGTVNLSGIGIKMFFFRHCDFFEHEMIYNNAVTDLHFESSKFHDKVELYIPKQIKDLSFKSNKHLKLSMIKCNECDLTSFVFADSYTEGEYNELIIEDFESFGPLSADKKNGIDLSIVSHRIKSISNLCVIGTVNRIQFLTDHHPSRSFTDNFEQFSPYDIQISPNDAAIDLLKHFQNASFSFQIINFEYDEEELPGQLFEQNLPMMTMFANHPIRKQLIALNNARKRRSLHPLKKIPNELMRMIGMFLELTPNEIRRFDRGKLNQIFGEHMIEGHIQPEHIYPAI